MTEPRTRSNRIVVVSCVAFVAAMGGAAFAAVPLYQMFCRTTGFGGATIVATEAPATMAERTVQVRFDTNVAPGLPWVFKSEDKTVRVKLGETKLVHFTVTNDSNRETTGTASYNVTPALVGSYFAKMQCFCFTSQTLQPGETLEMPVVFFVDPGMVEDKDVATVDSITLSYTFFAQEKPKTPVAAAKPAASPAPL